jgi:competence protein ComFC
VRTLKYGVYLRILEKVMAPLMADVLSGCRDGNTFDAIVPVPLHRSRLAKRGFNQAELIAQGVTRRINAAVLDKLKVVRRTKDQSSSPPARRANVAGAFASWGPRGRQDSPPRRRLRNGRHPERVLRVRRKAGAGELHALTLCRISLAVSNRQWGGSWTANGGLRR